MATLTRFSSLFAQDDQTHLLNFLFVLPFLFLDYGQKAVVGNF